MAVVGRPKGTKKTGGRKKGTPNKIPSDLKRMILGALDKAGGEQYLMRQANENPTAFMGLVGKVLPTTIKGDGKGGGLVLKVVTGVDERKDD